MPRGPPEPEPATFCLCPCLADLISGGLDSCVCQMGRISLTARESEDLVKVSTSTGAYTHRPPPPPAMGPVTSRTARALSTALLSPSSALQPRQLPLSPSHPCLNFLL